MPIYEFRCVKCGQIQEVLVSRASEEIVMKCQECEGEELERVLSRVNHCMGGGSSSADASSGPCSVDRKCGSGNSCTTLELPGYSK